MTQSWKQFEGQVAGGKFTLGTNLGGSESSGVFQTERAGQKAAIKLIPANAKQSDALLTRFARAATLSHPNLLNLFESGRCRIGDEDCVYVVMENADENLSEILPQRALTPAEVGEMLPPLLEALAYLHGRGLVHGEIKPSNIFAVDDRVKISSDGIGVTGDRPNRSSGYDAPEIGTTGCSSSADVWALGVTLVEVLTQQRPEWQPKNQDEPAIPQSVTQPFLDIARNCLRRDPTQRWNVSSIKWRLRPTWSAPPVQATQVTQAPAIAEAPVRVQRAPQVGRPKPPVRWRHLAPAAAILLLAVIVILVAPKVLNRPHGPSGEVSAVEQTTIPAEKSVRAPAVKHIAETQPAVGKSEALSAPSTTESPNAAAEIQRGEVVQQVLPNVPQKALDTINGTIKVRVRVQVDPTGDVSAANLDSPGPSKYFANLAMNAAREWKFSPTASDAESATREWLLRFEFMQGGAKAFPAPSRP